MTLCSRFEVLDKSFLLRIPWEDNLSLQGEYTFFFFLFYEAAFIRQKSTHNAQDKRYLTEKKQHLST